MQGEDLKNLQQKLFENASVIAEWGLFPQKKNMCIQHRSKHYRIRMENVN